MSNIDLSKLPDKAPEYDLRNLLEAGCHFGHQKNKWNPQMDEFIYTQKDGVHIFDLAKTAEQLQTAYNFMYQMGRKGKKVVIVGTKRQAREVVRKTAEESGMLYITSRWLGGFLTNWDQIKKSLNRMKTLEENFKKGEYDVYTKYEQAQLKKELTRLRRFFEGLRELKGTPDAIFVIDPSREDIAVKEAEMTGVPTVAIVDSNGNPDMVDIPIPANDDAIKSVTFLVEEMGKAYLAGKEGK